LSLEWWGITVLFFLLAVQNCCQLQCTLVLVLMLMLAVSTGAAILHLVAQKQIALHHSCCTPTHTLD
jgi:hypothetical protein